jgi:hypothetical protein
MKFCIRREIDLANIHERLNKVKGVPIELGLSPDLDVFLRERHRLVEVARNVKELGIPVSSVHAPHGQIADANFKNWAMGVIGFAEAVGAGIAVFHPEKRSKEDGQDEQAAALANIKHVQDRTRVTMAVETFWDKSRVLTPDEIMEHHLPMVLDTSLIPRPEITWIVESYRTHLVNIHLSGVKPGGRDRAGHQHQPIDSDAFCLDLLDRLFELGWNGVVTLEYMPWLQDKSLEDRHLLERIYHHQHTSS